MQMLIEQAAVVASSQKAAKEHAYLRLVEAVASDAYEGHPEDVLAVCEAAGKTLEELNSDVAKLAYILDLAKRAVPRDDVEARIRDIDSEINESLAKRDAELERHRLLHEQLSRERGKCVSVLAKAKDANKELKEHLPIHLRLERKQLRDAYDGECAVVHRLHSKLHNAAGLLNRIESGYLNRKELRLSGDDLIAFQKLEAQVLELRQEVATTRPALDSAQARMVRAKEAIREWDRNIGPRVLEG